MLMSDDWPSRANFEECLEELLFVSFTHSQLLFLLRYEFIQQEFPHLEGLASRVRYPHFPTSFENVLRAKFGDDCALGEQQDQVIIMPSIITNLIIAYNLSILICMYIVVRGDVLSFSED